MGDRPPAGLSEYGWGTGLRPVCVSTTMPELPEAETIVCHLRAHIVDATIVALRLLRPDVVHGPPPGWTKQLTGQRIAAVTRRAKRVQITVGDLTLVVRLGMSGRLTLHRPDEPLEKHTHVVWTLESAHERPRLNRAPSISVPASDEHARGGPAAARGGRIAPEDRDRRFELRFRDPRRFGGVWIIPGGGHSGDNGSARNGDQTNGGRGGRNHRNARQSGDGRTLGPLGPEPLTLAPAAFLMLLAGRQRPVKSLLLDQTRIAGLGNIYCDEALHAAGIHPASPCAAIPDDAARRLLRAIKSVLGRAIRAGGSTLNDYQRPDGSDGLFQFRHRVYGRAGQPCRRCRTPIEKTTLVGRGTHFCPKCQK